MGSDTGGSIGAGPGNGAGGERGRGDGHGGADRADGAGTDSALVSVSAAPRRLEPLAARHMPADFSTSLDRYRRGGTDAFLAGDRSHLERRPMRGFDPDYVDIVDYIVRITHRIWEEKDIGYIYDTYSHDCTVWDEFGLQYGRDKIVADTVHTNNAFPDIRLVADEVIWAGDPEVGFHTSHRVRILGTNTGWSRYGPPTGRRVALWCIADCVSRDNEIFHEHVMYDVAGMIQQLGLDVREVARAMAAERAGPALPPNFAVADAARVAGQGKPAAPPAPARVGDDVEGFARAVFGRLWNRRDFGAVDRHWAPDAVMHGSTDRVYRGHGEIRSFALSMVAMFPDLALSVDHVYWMGNPAEGFLVAVRWSASGTHAGFGPYGAPTGRPVHLRGLTQWEVRDDRIVADWTLFNEFGLLVQTSGG